MTPTQPPLFCYCPEPAESSANKEQREREEERGSVSERVPCAAPEGDVRRGRDATRRCENAMRCGVAVVVRVPVIWLDHAGGVGDQGARHNSKLNYLKQNQKLSFSSPHPPCFGPHAGERHTSVSDAAATTRLRNHRRVRQSQPAADYRLNRSFAGVLSCRPS